MFYMYYCKLLKKFIIFFVTLEMIGIIFSLRSAIGCPTEPLNFVEIHVFSKGGNSILLLFFIRKLQNAVQKIIIKTRWRQVLGFKKPSSNKTGLHQPKTKAFEDVDIPPRVKQSGAEWRILHITRFFNTDLLFEE